jgi:hypothetical protein
MCCRPRLALASWAAVCALIVAPTLSQNAAANGGGGGDGGDQSSGACRTEQELAARCAEVTAECCDENSESCSSGMPTVSNPGCATVLFGVQRACSEFFGSGPALTVGAFRTIKQQLDDAAALCPALGSGQRGAHRSTGSPCEEVYCNRHGSCKKNDDGGFLVCQCAPGWTGDGCMRPQLHAVITVDAKASVPERRAAESLAAFLNRISGAASFEVWPADAAIKGTPQIAVGFGAAMLLGVHHAAVEGLGLEGVLATTDSSQGVPPGSAALTGGEGAPRGALYAVDEFLERLGVQFLDRLPGGTRLPAALPDALPLEVLDVTRWTQPLEVDRCVREHLANLDKRRA